MHQTEPPPLSMSEKIQRAQWLCSFPALTSMVLLRHHIGFRMLGAGVLVMTFMLVGLGKIAQDGISGPLFYAYAAFFLFRALQQRFKRWREFRRGVLVHSSYYIGDSIFEPWPWPQFMRRERRIARFIDPAFAITVGLLLLPVCPLFGLWIAFSGLCLRFFETFVYERDTEREMDTADAIIDAQNHLRLANHFSVRVEQLENRTSQTESGIPTGYAADVQNTILRRQTRRKPPTG